MKLNTNISIENVITIIVLVASMTLAFGFMKADVKAIKKEMEKQVGVMQMPAVVLEDGRWMTDTTKMIQWFEDQIKENKTVPKDPVQAFICYLLLQCRCIDGR